MPETDSTEPTSKSSNSGTVWRRTDAVLWRSMAGGGVLRAPETGEYVTLRSTANLLWLALEFPGTKEELLSDIVAAAGEDCTAEVDAALLEFIELGVILPV